MSAIAGILNSNKEPIVKNDSNGMMTALQKYPADDVQTWQQGSIFLGCHAQWITPESVGEKLPYHDPESKLTITADAIIDNREELFEALHVSKALRNSMPDSKLILLSYQKWGQESPKHLIGDFAFMIWDERNQKLFGARDFSGSRTLYYYQCHKRFAFCTAIGPMLSLSYIEKQLNEQWLAEFLAIPSMNDTVDCSLTPYEGIEQLPPSHSITVYNGKTIISRYSTILEGQKTKFKTNDEYAAAFREVFQTAVNSRLRTTHKIGAHLSGGLDSSSVASFASTKLKSEKRRLHTYSYIPEENFTDWTPKYRLANETPYIESTLNHIGNAEKNLLDFKNKSPLTEMDDWLDIMEMPYKFFENSFWVKGIFEAAKEQGVGVLLNGARGNFTISWGPALDYYATLLRKMRWFSLSRELTLYSKHTGVENRFRVLNVVGRKAFPFVNNIIRSREPYKLPVLINSEFAKKMNVAQKIADQGIYMDGTSKSNPFEIRKRHFEQLYTWNTTGTSNTKLSLRYSLWNRDPTNDIRVIKFCLSLPESQFVQNGVDRSLIRRATENYLPNDVRLNQKVRGIQGADWVYRMKPLWNQLIDELHQLSKDPLTSQYLNTQLIEEGIRKVKSTSASALAFDPNLRMLMRSLIVYRFIKKF